MADDQDGQDSAESAKGLRKQLEDALAARDRDKAEFDAFKTQQAKETAFAKAGIPDSGMGEMFRKAYDGDLTTDAIKAKALELGLLQQERETDGDERDQLLSLQSDQTPGRRAADKSVIADAMTRINGMTDNEEIFDLVRELGLNVG